MIDNIAKDTLYGRLHRDREALLWKIDGLSEYDVRRPLTATGTNLLGLVKHLANVEARYFGEVFGRPSPEVLSPWQEADGSDLWVAEDETREQIVALYRRTWEHSDATVAALPLDAAGHVPWWPQPHADTNLFAVLVHVAGETLRHSGHADILRENLDGRVGLRPEHVRPVDEAARAAHWKTVEEAAKAAAAKTA
ncbi:DinB family protein [Streptomyces sp. NPDC056144]|uniref:DinB family protein n=1 Tax=unclassified Streptomyces TaxID=2593676 RepID=UPI0035D9A39A